MFRPCELKPRHPARKANPLSTRPDTPYIYRNKIFQECTSIAHKALSRANEEYSDSLEQDVSWQVLSFSDNRLCKSNILFISNGENSK